MQREASAAVGVARALLPARGCQVELCLFAHVAAAGNVVLSAGCDVQARPSGDGLAASEPHNGVAAQFEGVRDGVV
ncbi:MAG: hypothetical protein C0423_03330 [Methylibium sp.]|nr:hypothetical protein [Methylibium sp.]